MRNEKISVIVPCYNECQNIYKNLEKIHNYLVSHFTSFEIITINDGSKDNTLAELERSARSLHFTIINNPINTGKGDAVKKGILASNPHNDLVMFLDADLAIPIEELEKFADVIRENKFDIAIASRFVPGLTVLEPVLLHRKMMEIVFRFLRAIILNDWQVRDSQCGFKVFRRSTAIKIFTQTTVARFAFDSEVIFLARKLHFSIKELPITLCNPPKSHIRMFFDPINMFCALFAIRWNHIKGIYNIKRS